MSAEHRDFEEVLGGLAVRSTGINPVGAFLTGDSPMLYPSGSDITLYTVLDDWIFDADPAPGGGGMVLFYNHYYLNQSPQ